MQESIFSDLKTAIEAIAAGGMVVLVDDEDRENEGDVVVAAEKITPELINFMVTHCRGLVCLPMQTQDLERLQIPLMAERNSKFRTAFTLSIEAAVGVTTGISAADRAHTVLTAINLKAKSTDIVTPGHIFPIQAKPGGVLSRAGHTEGSIDLVQMAGCLPSAVICEIMNDDGSMARLPDLIKFAKKFKLPIVSINQLIAQRMEQENLVTEVARAQLPLEKYGDFQVRVFENIIDKGQHVVLIRGHIDPDKAILTRVHSECLTGDIFGSRRCDCGWQLHAALEKISQEGGVLIYLRDQEGRGIGLGNKIKAYALQENGLDTVEANHHLGFKADHRDYGIGSQILRQLGIRKIRLLTNNPKKIYGLEGYGLTIEGREKIIATTHSENQKYLQTKARKLGHLFDFSENPDDAMT